VWPLSRKTKAVDPHQSGPLSVSALYPLLGPWAPSLIEALDEADKRAGARLLDAATYLPPVLRGVEEFRQHFTKLSTDHPCLDPDIASLCGQVAEHIYLGIQSCIFTPGPHSGDDARFLMEAQFLFSDFAVNPDRIAEWRDAEPHRRNQIFGFGKLRQRREKTLGVPSGQVLPDRDEYSVHSALVHPRPGREVGTGEVTPQARRTYITLSLGDLLEHARRTCGAAQEMLAALVDRGMPPDALNEWRSLDREAIEDAIKFLAQVTPASPTGARPQTVSIQSPLGGGQ
jgi:hypothetical protein